ncbi:MAG: hypothetical protein Q7T71_07660 [Herbiconiux sp.]|nr:hypothetical protein [Herbiconiux sp.]
MKTKTRTRPIPSKTLDSPGLVAIGIAGRRHRIARRARLTVARVASNKWVIRTVGTVGSGVVGKIIVQRIVGS